VVVQAQSLVKAAKRTPRKAPKAGELFDADDDAAHRLALRIARELADWERVNNASVVVKTEDGRLVSEVPLNQLLN